MECSRQYLWESWEGWAFALDLAIVADALGEEEAAAAFTELAEGIFNRLTGGDNGKP